MTKSKKPKKPRQKKTLTIEELVAKWEPFLKNENVPIKDVYKRRTTPVLLGPTY